MWLRGLKCLDRVRRPCIWGWDGWRGRGAAEEYFTMLDVHITKTGSLRLAAVLAVAISANACSSLPDVPYVPDWVDPTTWFGDDTTTVRRPTGQRTDARSCESAGKTDRVLRGRSAESCRFTCRRSCSREIQFRRSAWRHRGRGGSPTRCRVRAGCFRLGNAAGRRREQTGRTRFGAEAEHRAC